MREALLLTIAVAALSGTTAPAHAESAIADAPRNNAAAPPPHYHSPTPADIIVTAPYQQDRFDSLSGISILQGDQLIQALRPSIGETLARTAGVSATSFGPTASRPILRGQQGERVRILTDGIGTIDASSASPDHAVAINPLLAERIEVLRGPEALLYGSSAIGGVVNVIDRRIPRHVPDEAIHVQGLAGWGSAANERSASAAADIAIGKRFVLHADGSYLKTDDLRIGGHALSSSARAQALQSSQLPLDQQVDATGEPLDFAGTAAIRGKLPNSMSRTWTAGAGLAFITDTGNFGISYSRYDSFYGVPLRYATRPGEAQEAPRIDLVQNRFDARAEIRTDGDILSAINTRFGYASYRHDELEEDGEIGTTFTSKGLEGRLELVQTQHGVWKGATGAQFTLRDFDVTGEEAFLPENSASEIGFFTLQQLDYGALKLQAGARYEHSTATAKPRADADFFAGSRSFNSFSASFGASHALAENWRISLDLARGVRAPAAEELFANGPHAGTQSYEIGNPDLRTERSWGAEVVLRGRGDGYHIEASAYASWFRNFIYDARSGEIEDGLPVYRLQQGKARYYGFELQGGLDLASFGGATLSADGLADYTRATITDVGPAPRIPPLRLLGGLNLRNNTLDLRGEVEWVSRQNHVSAFETETPGYTLVNAEVNIRPWGTARPLSLAISANNLFNVTARRHSSLLKDFAPLSGRDIRLSAWFSF